MASPQGSTTFYVTPYAAATLIVAGNLVMPISGTDGWVVATAAARGTARCSGMAMSITNGSGFGTVEIWQGGSVDPSISGLGTGAASWVRCSTAGIAERFTPVNAGTSDVIGWCETDGRVHLLFGVLTETMLVGGGGSIALPTPVTDGDIYYAASGALARLAKGSAGQVLTQGATFPTWANGASVFDPTNLNLTSYFRASYAGSPWNSNATPGVSSSATLTSATPGVVGTAVNGFVPVSFDGSSTSLAEPTRVASTYLSTTAYSYAVLVNVDSTTVAAAAANAYQDKMICGVTGDLGGIAVSTSGVRAWHYDGSFSATGFVAMTTNAWHLVTVKYVGGVLSISVDTGTPVTLSKGAPQSLSTAAWEMGKSSSTPLWCKEQILECWTAGSDQSASFANYKTYLNTRYGLAL